MAAAAAALPGGTAKTSAIPISRGDWIRTSDPLTPREAASQTVADFRDVTNRAGDECDPLLTTPTRNPDTSDPVESALADGVRALAEAMRRAPADALPALAERMAIVVRELAARREAQASGSHLA